MANVFAPFGFAVSGRQDGASWSANQTAYPILYSNTHQFFTGDVVQLLNTGYIDTVSPGTTAILGIFAGCQYVSASQGRLVQAPYFPGADVVANTTVTAFVIDDPMATFVAQTGWSTGTPSPATQAMVGMNAQFAVGTGSTLNGQSGAYVDLHVAPATTSTLPFRILSLISDPPGANGADTTTAYNNVVLGFNNQFFKQLTGI